ncbi:MAG TPA: DNA translocase FtsK 4TM domain-containing protein [Candidatus Angelobacter sp.]|nr:DNA translocase FtsK 4TM domain-containing protein [Candidatus Angelobacter sp.]
MRKRKKSSRKNRLAKSTPQHDLPIGFWSQIGALFLIAVSILFVIAWFGAGGPVLEWLHKFALTNIGYAVYVVPALFIYVAVEIFRVEDNRLPFVMKVATVSSILWFSALFGLLKNGNGQTTGGLIGDLINKGVLVLVNSSIAAFIYVLLILITLLFILRVSPFTVIKKIWRLTRRDMTEHDSNAEVMRNAAAIDKSESVAMSEFKLNASVPTLNSGSDKNTYKSSPKSVIHDRAETALTTVSDPNWEPPSIDLLEKKQSPADPGDVQGNAKIIKDTLDEFDIDVKMDGANIGPRVTQYTMKPASGVKLTRITQLETNLALNLGASSLRIEAPIPGQKAVGIEVPNLRAADVRLHSILSSKEWERKTDPLTFAIGQDISGAVILGELGDMPHLLIAGQTKAGKSVMINTLLTSLLYHNSPSDIKLILIDPKRVEMVDYEDIPHLLTPIITETDKTISALKWATHEMDNRYVLLQDNRVRNIADFNSKIQMNKSKIPVADEEGIIQDYDGGVMPHIIIVIDELSDLIGAAPKDMESLIVRLAQKGRAAGLHLVIATQSPRVNVITGLIKANIPAKIAFTVANRTESQIILDQNGAEKLLNHGDMLLKTASMSKSKRVQGAWVTDAEVKRITDYLRMQSKPQYNDEVVSQPVHLNGKGGVVMDFDSSNDDDLYKDAVRVVIDSNKASASLLQRRLRVGYARAARLIENMEDQGIIGPADGARSREVLISGIDEVGGDSEIIDDDL